MIGRTPASRRRASKSTSKPRSLPEKHSPLSDSTPAGSSHVSAAVQNVVQACSLVASVTAREAHATREWSSTMLKIFTGPGAAAITQSIESICHHSFGAGASKRRHDDFGRFSGAGSTNPRRTRIRCAVATDGTGAVNRSSRPRCHWIVVAP